MVFGLCQRLQYFCWRVVVGHRSSSGLHKDQQFRFGLSAWVLLMFRFGVWVYETKMVSFSSLPGMNYCRWLSFGVFVNLFLVMMVYFKLEARVFGGWKARNICQFWLVFAVAAMLWPTPFMIILDPRREVLKEHRWTFQKFPEYSWLKIECICNLCIIFRWVNCFSCPGWLMILLLVLQLILAITLKTCYH